MAFHGAMTCLLLLYCGMCAVGQITVSWKEPTCEDSIRVTQMNYQQLAAEVDDLKAEMKNTKLQISPPQYLIFYDLKTWAEADIACKAIGRTLITFNDTDKIRIMTDLVKVKCPASKWHYQFWTSGMEAKNNQYIWTSNQKWIDSDEWCPGEPTGEPNADPGDQICVHIWEIGQDNHCINDIVCQRKMCYICEL